MTNGSQRGSIDSYVKSIPDQTPNDQRHPKSWSEKPARPIIQESEIITNPEGQTRAKYNTIQARPGQARAGQGRPGQLSTKPMAHVSFICNKQEMSLTTEEDIKVWRRPPSGGFA